MKLSIPAKSVHILTNLRQPPPNQQRNRRQGLPAGRQANAASLAQTTARPPFEQVHFRDVETTGGRDPGLATPLRVGLETRCRPSYGQRGATRTIDSPACVFQFTLAGIGQFEDDTGCHDLPAGSGFLCESHDPRIAYRYPPAGRQPWRFVYLSFAAAPMAPLVRALGDRLGRLVRLPPASPSVRRLVHLAEIDEPTLFISAGEGAALVFDLLGEIAAAMPRGREHPDEMLFQRVTQEIHRRLADGRVEVGEVAATVGVSQGQLFRLFRRQAGDSPYQFIVRKQMLLACQWLAEGRTSVKEIADRLGFSTPANFVRAFKKAVGQTTRQFRQGGQQMPGR